MQYNGKPVATQHLRVTALMVSNN